MATKKLHVFILTVKYDDSFEERVEWTVGVYRSLRSARKAAVDFVKNHSGHEHCVVPHGIEEWMGDKLLNIFSPDGELH